MVYFIISMTCIIGVLVLLGAMLDKMDKMDEQNKRIYRENYEKHYSKKP